MNFKYFNAMVLRAVAGIRTVAILADVHVPAGLSDILVNRIVYKWNILKALILRELWALF